MSRCFMTARLWMPASRRTGEISSDRLSALCDGKGFEEVKGYQPYLLEEKGEDEAQVRWLRNLSLKGD
jgi:hypothetical protein